MLHLSSEAKESIVQKALSKDRSSTIVQIAKAHNIGCSTLQRWVRRYNDGGTFSVINPSKEISLEIKFNHLMAVSSLDETAVGVYCRRQGLFSFQLKQWKEEFMMQACVDKRKHAARAELRLLRIENKELKKELRRKDSALAETASLLILQKKHH